MNVQHIPVTVKVSPKVGIGFTTISGMTLAISQYAGAVAAILAGDLTAESIGLLATGTVTLATTLVGRYQQAKAAIEAVGRERAANQAVTIKPVRPLEEKLVVHLDGELIAEAVVKSMKGKN